MNVKDMKEFIKDLPDDTKLTIMVGDTRCDGKHLCIFAGIKRGVGVTVANGLEEVIVFQANQENYDGYADRRELFKNIKDAYWG